MSRGPHFLKAALAMFVIATLLLPHLHPLLLHNGHAHEHEHQGCSAELEHDPCHRRLVHHDVSVDCEHDGHITELQGKCDLCDWLISRTQYILTGASLTFVFLESRQIFFDFEFEAFADFRLGNKGRGPPVFDGPYLIFQ